jgi:hypothetical protein
VLLLEEASPPEQNRCDEKAEKPDDESDDEA